MKRSLVIRRVDQSCYNGARRKHLEGVIVESMELPAFDFYGAPDPHDTWLLVKDNTDTVFTVRIISSIPIKYKPKFSSGMSVNLHGIIINKRLTNKRMKDFVKRSSFYNGKTCLFERGEVLVVHKPFQLESLLVD